MFLTIIVPSYFRYKEKLYAYSAANRSDAAQEGKKLMSVTFEWLKFSGTGRLEVNGSAPDINTATKISDTKLTEAKAQAATPVTMDNKKSTSDQKSARAKASKKEPASQTTISESKAATKDSAKPGNTATEPAPEPASATKKEKKSTGDVKPKKAAKDPKPAKDKEEAASATIEPANGR